MKQATVSDLIKANKSLKLLKSNDVSLTFPKLGDLAKYSLVIYSDASFANLTGYASQDASIVFLSNAEGTATDLWHSRKRVAKSKPNAETLALLDGIEDGIFIRQIVCELLNGILLDVIANVDCKKRCDSVNLYKS